MNKIILILIIVIVLVIAAGGFIYYANQNSAYKAASPNQTNNEYNTNMPASGNQQENQSAQPQNLNASVSIKNFAFNPATLAVKTGTTVTWTNNDSAPHQIKSNDFNSSALNSGQTFSFTFSVAGEYNYSCAIHPSMTGKIIVTN